MAADLIIDPSSLTASEGFALFGGDGDRVGTAVSSAGDVNDDGIDDFIVAADEAKEIYVIYGKTGAARGNIDLANLSASDGFIVEGITSPIRSVSSAGDVNGDGIDDLLFGDSFNGFYAEEAYVIFGKAGATRNNIDVDNLAATDGFTIGDSEDLERFGRPVSAAGDINGDGIDDFIVSGNTEKNERNDREIPGKVYVFFGKEGATRGDIDIAHLPASDGFYILGAADGDFAGYGASSAGDINGDGIDDLAVTVLGFETETKVVVVYGKSGAARSNIDLASFADSDGFVVSNPVSENSQLRRVSAAGDVNGDGLDDIIIGADNSGSAYVIYGKEGADRPDIDLSALPSTDGFAIQGAAAGDHTGESVSGGGDVNGDGFDDLIIGAPFSSADGYEYGRAYVILGKGGTTRGNLDLANLDAADGFVVRGTMADDILGRAVSSAGDVNGDGFDDVLIGAPQAYDSTSVGKAYVIYGSEAFSVPNEPPVALPATAEAVEDGPLVTGQLEASDPDGDTLTFSPVLTGQFAPGVAGLTINADGSYSFDPSDAEYQSLAEGEVMELLGGYFVSDGDLTDSSTLTITITGVNDAPVIAPSVPNFTTTLFTAHAFAVSASDPEGSPITYSADDPDHGTVTGGVGGHFIYTPDPGYLGTDSVTVTVSDVHGAMDMQSFVVTVNPPPAADFRLFASDGYVGEIGGSGQVFGTAGFQDITVLDEAGTIAFDPSFNKGGDIVRLSGNAGDWGVVQSGSAAIFSDGDTFVQLPIGTAGIAIMFDDGVRSLRFDAGAGSFRIGSQSFATELVQITAPTDGAPLPTGADEDASARLFLGTDKSASAGGHLDVFGTSGAEQLTVTQGEVSLDPSFNKGGDTLVLGDPAPGFLASRSGSTVLLDGAATDVVIPVGLVGMTIAFPGDNHRILQFDTMLGNPVIGTQEIDTTPTALVAFG